MVGVNFHTQTIPIQLTWICTTSKFISRWNLNHHYILYMIKDVDNSKQFFTHFRSRPSMESDTLWMEKMPSIALYGSSSWGSPWGDSPTWCSPHTCQYSCNLWNKQCKYDHGKVIPVLCLFCPYASSFCPILSLFVIASHCSCHAAIVCLQSLDIRFSFLRDWEDNAVTSTIERVKLEGLDFPAVTVCPDWATDQLAIQTVYNM